MTSPGLPVLDPAVAEMWERFCAATQVDAPLEGWFAFGDSPAAADALAELVLIGDKRAAASLLADFALAGDPLPRAGDHWVVLDGSRRPRCVVRTTEVEVKHFAAVDGWDAWDAGEGDRSVEDWRTVHRRFFGQRCRALDIEMSDWVMVVMERFELVWPQPDGSAARVPEPPR